MVNTGLDTLNLAQKIVKLVYTDEYQQQFEPTAKSYINPTGRDNWIKSDWLKQLLEIKHPLVTAYIRQIPVIHYKTHDEYQGNMQFHFHVPNKFGTEDIQQYTLAWLLDAYGDLRGAICELYQIAAKLWEPCKKEWNGIEVNWDWKQLQWVPSDKLAAALDKDHVHLMEFMLFNLLDRGYDDEKWEGWYFFQYENEVYIGMSDHYISSIISLEEFLTSPMNHQVITSLSTKSDWVAQAVTLRGVVNGSNISNW